MDKYACHPTEQSSPVHFCDPRQAEVIRALPYHVVAPMSYEYPYWAGQAQETISSRLLMASHYGFQVVRPGYLCPGDGPTPEDQTEECIQSGEALDDYILDMDVRKAYRPKDLLSVGHEGQRTYTCREESCRAVGGMPYYFTNVEQWVAHWNTFHVAVAAGYTCTAGECGAKVPPGPDALDVFMQHVVRKHDELSQNNTWPKLPMMVHRGTFMGPNPHYWQPRQPHEKPYRPCRVLPYPNEEEAGPVIQARLAASPRPSTEREESKEARVEEREEDATKGMVNH